MVRKSFLLAKFNEAQMDTQKAIRLLGELVTTEGEKVSKVAWNFEYDIKLFILGIVQSKSYLMSLGRKLNQWILSIKVWREIFLDYADWQNRSLCKRRVTQKLPSCKETKIEISKSAKQSDQDKVLKAIEHIKDLHRRWSTFVRTFLLKYCLGYSNGMDDESLPGAEVVAIWGRELDVHLWVICRPKICNGSNYKITVDKRVTQQAECQLFRIFAVK